MRHSCNRTSLVCLLLASVALLPMTFTSCTPPPGPPPDTTITLQHDWQIFSGLATEASGSEISSPGLDSSSWISAEVPTTVLAAQVRAGKIEDPYFGRKLEQIPVEPYAAPWWYRTEFTLDNDRFTAARLVLEGVNYSANVWLNGERVGTRDQIVGAFRVFELDVGDVLTEGLNVLAIEVHPPQPGDPTIGFVDWNPEPPDRNMGLWRPVKLRLTGEVSMDDVFVTSDLDLATLEHASLSIRSRLTNHSDSVVTATMTGVIDEEIRFDTEVELDPGEERTLVLSPEQVPQLDLENPRLWWPNLFGEPNLYNLELTTTVDGRISDRQQVTFGIRHIEDYFNEEGHRGYRINGKKVLIRGGGWVDDLMLADDDQRLEDQIRYVKHMNLNTIRLEGFWGSSQKLFDLADRYGILVMVGWSCQWEWEGYLGGPVDDFGGIDTPAEMDLIARSLRDQVVWLRNHPSVFLWVLGSDMLPRPDLENRYYTQLAEVDTTRPTLAACAVADSEVSGPTGVKMNGPYDYVPPVYWYIDRERGGAYGFNTETGPGPQPPPVESIQRMMPEENWWPVDDMWDYHSGRNEFNTIARYHEALDKRYGEATDLHDFTRKAQVANYEAMRAMFESFSIRRPSTTGLIQWMLNSAWPELFWQLYDYYLVPNGAFYGARDASRPINIAFDFADRRIVVVNDTTAALEEITVQVRVLDLQSEILFEGSQSLSVPSETVQEVLVLPSVSPPDKVYFVDCKIEGADGTLLASNLYWLSTQEDVMDWEASEWFYTPIDRFADLTALARMPAAAIEVEHRFESSNGGQTVHVSLTNPSDQLAFFIELKVTGAQSGRLAAPVLWDDNYISLMPGESKEIRGRFEAHALPAEEAVFSYTGWNVKGE